MDFLKEFFEAKETDLSDKETNWETFAEWVKATGFDIVDVKSGGYKKAEELDRKLKAQAESLKADYEVKKVELEKAVNGKESKSKETQTEAEKLKAELDGTKKQVEAFQKAVDELKAESEKAKAENRLEKTKALYKDMGGDPEFAEDVANRWLSLVNNETPIEAVAENFKKEKPKYFSAVKKETVSTTASITGEEQKKAEEAAVAAVRKRMGLPEKKPG